VEWSGVDTVEDNSNVLFNPAVLYAFCKGMWAVNYLSKKIFHFVTEAGMLDNTG